MSEEKKRKNKIIAIVVGICAAIILIATSTYAFWTITKSQKDPNSIVAACLDITMEDQFGTLTPSQNMPISDAEGLQDSGFTFTVKNHCEQDVAYIIGIDSVEVDTTGTNGYMLDGSIKVSIDNTTPRIFGSLEDIDHVEANDTYVIRNSKKINTAVVPGKKNGVEGTDTHTIKAWIDADAPVSENNKVFGGRVFITGGQFITDDNPITQVTDESCFEMDGTEIIGYDENCGTSVVIPVSIDGVEVKTIDSNAFKGSALAPVYYDSDITNSGQTITPVGEVDFSTANVMFVFDNYEENTGLDLSLEGIIANAKYVAKLTTDAPVNDALDQAETAYGVTLYDVSEIPELTENQIAVYGKLDQTFDGPLLGAKYLKLQHTLVVKSLNLSQALNLEKIEASAFSNVPSTEFNLDNYINYNEGLEYLTFGNNNNPIQLEHNTFARMNVEDLKIYVSNYIMFPISQESQENEIRPYGYSKIGDLTIVGDINHKISGNGIIEDDGSGNYIYTIYGEVKATIVNNLYLENIETFNANTIKDMTIGTLTIPNLIGFADSSFGGGGAKTIDKIVLLDGINVIPKHMFENSRVREVILPDSVVTIEGYAFYNSFLHTINLPNKLENIGFAAFSGTDNYTTVIIPSSVTKIESSAFYAANGTPAKHIFIERGTLEGITLGTTWYNKDNSYINYSNN